MSYPTEIINQDLVNWAMRNKAVITEGECGFGRPCVGLMVAGTWVDYPRDNSRPPYFISGTAYYYCDPGFWTPPDAYHKHDCIAVLYHGEPTEAWIQLGDWLSYIMRTGYVVAEIGRAPSSDIDLLIHGTSTPVLVKP